MREKLTERDVQKNPAGDRAPEAGGAQRGH